MRKLIIFLLIIALTHSLTDGACTVRTDTVTTSTVQTKSNEKNDSVSTSVSNFFTDVGCTIKSGAKTVKEHVQSSYQFLKQKITNNDNITNSTENNHNNDNGKSLNNSNIYSNIPLAPEEYKLIDQLSKVPLAPEDEQIVYNGPIDTSTQQIQPIAETTTSDILLDDRIALTAPTICRKGERRENDKCRKVSNF